MIPTSNQQLAALLRMQRDELAQRIADRLIAMSSAHKPPLPDAEIADERSDISSLLLYLVEAIALDDPSLLADYLGWASTWLAAYGLSRDHLRVLLEQTSFVLRETLPAEMQPLVDTYLQAGKGMRDDTFGRQSLIGPHSPLGPLAQQYLDALLRGDRQRASQLVLNALRTGASIKAIYLHVFQVAQREVGRLFQTNRATIAEEHYCTAATQLIMGQLSSYVFGTERMGRSMVAAAVDGESHDIGIRMVADFFELEGWDSYYLGANTPEDAIVQAIVEQKADLLALSVTASFRVNLAAKAIEAVRAATPGVRILVGGYPFLVSPNLWRRVGADGSARDAEDAVQVAGELLAEEAS
jgi:methanogenic corrinoid protein MtbC1